MIDAFALAITVVSLAAAGVTLVLAAARRYRWSRLAPTLALLELALVVQAVADLVALARGHHPRELATHLAYLGVSVALLPVAAAQVRGDHGRWPAVLVAVVLVVLAVVTVRLETTWRATGA
jgi:peptidoglycan/LPS O-acetylase OafA/YrhL